MEDNMSAISSSHFVPKTIYRNGEVENMNKSLVKRLKIAAANKRDYKEEIQKFILMYNVTPHGTTGSAPSELMFNRRIRDKIPSIEDINENIIDSDNDLINKQKGKEKADMKRNAKDCNIQVGDNVLLKNVIFSNKLTPNFDKTTYEVVERNGSEVKIAGEGRTYTRNISMVKKIPDSPFAENTKTQKRETTTVDKEPILPTSNSVSSPNDIQPSSPNYDPPNTLSKKFYCSEADDLPLNSLSVPYQEPLKLKLKKVEGMWQH